MRRWLASIALLLGPTAACTPETCHEASTSAVPSVGDANADGAVDLADGLYVQRWLFRGGPAPACELAVDVVADGVVDAGDGFAIWSHAFAGDAAPDPLADGACDTRSAPTNELECGRFLYTVKADGRATGGFDATVELTTPDLDVEGWQVSLKAEGCRVASAGFAGTRGADSRDGGARVNGYGRADLASSGVVSAVALGWLDERALPAAEAPYPVLSFHVDATPPSAGCTPCVLTFEDGLQGPGQPVRNMVSRLGRAWRPTTQALTVDICAG